MANKKIKDLPLLETLDGTEIIPTGGKGDFGFKLNTLKNFVQSGSSSKKNHTQLFIEKNVTEEENSSNNFFLDINLTEFSTEVSVAITVPDDDTVYDNVLQIPLNIVSEDGEYIFTIKPSETNHLIFNDVIDFQPEKDNSQEVNLDYPYVLAHVRYFQSNGYKEAVVTYKK